MHHLLAAITCTTCSLQSHAPPARCNHMHHLLAAITQPSAATLPASLQDPSGAMGAAIHQALLDVQPTLGPGSALLLTQVTITTTPGGRGCIKHCSDVGGQYNRNHGSSPQQQHWSWQLL